MNGILGSAVLDVAIGMVFVYLLLAIICTTANEWVSSILQTRSKMLEKALRQMLDNQPGARAQGSAPAASGGAAPAAVPPAGPLNFVQQFYQHPIISGMMHGPGEAGHFSYLPSRAFATVVMDLVTPNASGRIDLETLEQGIKNMPDGDVKRGLLAAIQNAGNSLDDAQKCIEAWFDDTMDRVSGWYKRFSQKWIIALALLITIGVNADTLHMTRIFWMNPTLRAQIVEQAKARQLNTNPTSAVSSDEQKALEGLVGWDNPPANPKAWLLCVLGWLLTAAAVSLGAPFWFDTLNKFMNLRNAGKSPDESAKTPAKQQQPPDNKRP